MLTSSIFGVDLNPMAVWLCELRLWLSIVIESDDADPMRIAPLPNLDRHIRVGDSLAGGAFDDRGGPFSGRKIVSLRARYMRAVGAQEAYFLRGCAGSHGAARLRSDVFNTQTSVGLSAERKEILIALRARDLFGDRHAPDADTDSVSLAFDLV